MADGLCQSATAKMPARTGKRKRTVLPSPQNLDGSGAYAADTPDARDDGSDEPKTDKDARMPVDGLHPQEVGDLSLDRGTANIATPLTWTTRLTDGTATGGGGSGRPRHRPSATLQRCRRPHTERTPGALGRKAAERWLPAAAAWIRDPRTPFHTLESLLPVRQGPHVVRNGSAQPPLPRAAHPDPTQLPSRY